MKENNVNKIQTKRSAKKQTCKTSASQSANSSTTSGMRPNMNSASLHLCNISILIGSFLLAQQLSDILSLKSPFFSILLFVLVQHSHLSLRFNDHFPGEPGLAGFIGTEDNGSGGDNWSYKSCKAPVNTINEPTPNFLHAGCPSCRQSTVSKHGSEVKHSRHHFQITWHLHSSPPSCFGLSLILP